MSEAERSRMRRERDPWRRWYGLARWKRLRLQVLLEDLYQCADCGRVDSPKRLVVDHKVPHRGDPALFWLRSNLTTLCLHCHNSHKQSEERTGRKRPRYGLDGWPL